MAEHKRRYARILLNVNLACIIKYFFKKKLGNITFVCCTSHGGWLSIAAKLSFFGSNYYIYFPLVSYFCWKQLLIIENTESMTWKKKKKKKRKGEAKESCVISEAWADIMQVSSFSIKLTSEAKKLMLGKKKMNMIFFITCRSKNKP